TTGSATSASSRATRISRVVSSMSASDRPPLPRSALHVAARRSCRVANTSGSGCGGTDGRQSAQATRGAPAPDPSGERGAQLERDGPRPVVGERCAVGADHVEDVDRLGPERADERGPYVDAG